MIERVQEEKLNYLRNEVIFLREDSAHKSTIINNLVAITRQNMVEGTDSSGRSISSINSEESEYGNGSHVVVSNRACKSPLKHAQKVFSRNSREIAIEIENLKRFIQNILPDVKLSFMSNGKN